MNNIESSIVIQMELDKCNEKIKNYDIKYNTVNNQQFKLLYDYLNDILNDETNEFNEDDKKGLNDDINILINYL
jgi:hypothetical protein